MKFTPKITFFFSLSLTIILSLLSLINTTGCSLLPLRKVSIYSQIETDTAADASLYLTDVEPYSISFKPIDSVAIPEIKASMLSIDSVLMPKAKLIDTVVSKTSGSTYSVPANVTPIEDYSSNGVAFASFYKKLINASALTRPVRIAILGDSFIEGDIFAQDFRELMQDNFSGNGVGFVPITSAVAGFRKSVDHSFSGWTTSSILTKASKGNYTISSFTYTPTQGEKSSVTYKNTKYRRHLNLVQKARLLFVANGNYTITATINGTKTQTMNPEPSDVLTQFSISEDSIRSVSFSVSGAGGFTAYGASLEGANGVNVDNYSVRGNSGVGLSSINSTISEQFNYMMPVDMIIFEYGLNSVQSENKNYASYAKQMHRAVEQVRACFPGAAILIMGVPDRTRRQGDGWVTIPGVQAMANTQRQLAQTLGVAYWSTMDAMRKRGGMNKFVERGWAAKDFTHLSTRGGKEIGTALFDAVMYDVKRVGK